MRTNKKSERCSWCNDTGVQTNGERYGNNYHWWKCEKCKGDGKAVIYKSVQSQENS